ncbi:MAG: hypothetical protein RL653_444 [Pseudomonadota bacterium]|jgi:hypothetical protein
MGREAPGALPGPATGHEERPVGPGRTDERFVRRWLPAVRAVARLFRPRILGLEMLPVGSSAGGASGDIGARLLQA